MQKKDPTVNLAWERYFQQHGKPGQGSVGAYSDAFLKGFLDYVNILTSNPEAVELKVDWVNEETLVVLERTFSEHPPLRLVWSRFCKEKGVGANPRRNAQATVDEFLASEQFASPPPSPSIVLVEEVKAQDTQRWLQFVRERIDESFGVRDPKCHSEEFLEAFLESDESGSVEQGP